MKSNYRRFRRALALALVLGAVAAPAAAAKPADAPPGYVTPAVSERSSDSGYSSLNAITGPPPSQPTVTPAVAAADSGFDWGDAGIGAGAAFALTMIGLGGMLVVTTRRQREARQRAAA
jgi:hypothetical protein